MAPKKKVPVALIYKNAAHRGPGKVVQNLEAGLNKIGIEHGINHLFRSDVRTYMGILQKTDDWKNFEGLMDRALVGPNCFVLPSDDPAFTQACKHLVVPSQWVHDLYRRFSWLGDHTIDVWPVGIDTEKWKAWKKEAPKGASLGLGFKCLLYYKNRSVQDLDMVKSLMDRYKIEYHIVEYGKYTEEELAKECEWANMGVLLTDTESQGIAYMEILSTNLPCFVFNKWYWNYDGRFDKVAASSVPYFDSRCGIVTNNVDMKLFEEFLDGIIHNKYSPGEYIRENHTLEKSAKVYYSLLEKYQSSAFNRNRL